MEDNIKILQSSNRENYEILLRKRGNIEYASYCPQLNKIVKGKEHSEVKMAMETYIQEHISSIVNTEKVDYAPDMSEIGNNLLINDLDLESDLDELEFDSDE